MTAAAPFNCTECGEPVKVWKRQHTMARRRTGLCKSCAARKVWLSPEIKARRVASLRARFTDPAKLARARVLAANASAARMAWCPPGYRDAYRELRRKLPAAEARPALRQLVEREVADFMAGKGQDLATFTRARSARTWKWK